MLTPPKYTYSPWTCSLNYRLSIPIAHSCSVKLFRSELNISRKHAPLIFLPNAVNGNSTPQVLRMKFPFPHNKISTEFCWLHLQFLPPLLLLPGPSYYHVLSGLLCSQITVLLPLSPFGIF